jgi:hypothetical protein
MDTVDIILWAIVAACATAAAWIEFRQRNGWAPIYLLLVIALAFFGHWLYTLGAFQ